MDMLTSTYLSRAEFWLFFSTLLYFLMNGAQIFETLVFVPKWAASPPSGFSLLNGPGAGLKSFWIILHALHELSFILAIVFCWKIGFARNWLLISFAVHLALRVWTLTYFAPNIIHFQKIAGTQVFSPGLAAKTALWQTLNYIRVAVFMAVSIGLLPLCLRVFRLRP
ncbi:MAG: transposase [Flavobacteriales bacterium]